MDKNDQHMTTKCIDVILRKKKPANAGFFIKIKKNYLAFLSLTSAITASATFLGHAA